MHVRDCESSTVQSFDALKIDILYRSIDVYSNTRKKRKVNTSQNAMQQNKPYNEKLQTQACDFVVLHLFY